MPSVTSRAPSETNLSSSGYSSMASPASSRCGSANKLCASESEDTTTPTSTSNFFNTHLSLGFVRRPSPLLKSPSCDSESSDQNPVPVSLTSRVARDYFRSGHHDVINPFCTFQDM